MKIGIIAVADIAATEDLRLDAAHYLEPTLHVDKDIARTERTIKSAQERLIRLKKLRETILARRRRETHGKGPGD